MAGYIKNLGTDKKFYSEEYLYYQRDLYNFVQAARLTPSVSYTWKKHLMLGLEYEINAAQYGDKGSVDLATGLATENIRWALDHCITLHLGCSF